MFISLNFSILNIDHIASFFKTSPAMFLKFTSQIISMALCCLCLDDKLRISLLCLYEGHHVSSINYKLSYLRTNIRALLSISRFMYENICLKSLPRTIYFEASTFSPAEIFPNQSKLFCENFKLTAPFDHQCSMAEKSLLMHTETIS